MESRIFCKTVKPEEAEAYLEQGYRVEDNTIFHEATAEELDLHQHIPGLAERNLGGPMNFSLTEYDPLNLSYSDQRIVQTHRRADPNSNPAFLEATLRQSPPLGRILSMSERFGDHYPMIDRMRAIRRAGGNICMLVPHTAIHDVPYPLVAYQIADGSEDIVQNSGTLMSKQLTRFTADIPGLGTLHVPEFVGLASTLWYSIPRTKTTLESLMRKEVAENINPQMRQDFASWLQEGGKVVAIAPTGTVLKKDTLHRVSSGTRSLIASFDYVLPMPLDITQPEGNRWFYIGELTAEAHGQPEQVHNIMGKLAVHQSHLVGRDIKYEAEPPKDTVDKVKAATRETVREVVKQFQERREKRRQKHT